MTRTLGMGVTPADSKLARFTRCESAGLCESRSSRREQLSYQCKMIVLLEYQYNHNTAVSISMNK